MTDHEPSDAVPGVQVPGDPEGEAARTQSVLDDEDADLRSSLSGLSGLAAGQLSLPVMLRHVAEFAVRAIPGADGAGLTLLEDDRADTIVATADFVTEVDAIQYGIGEGPCITAATERRTVRSGSLGGEPTWPRFGPRVGRLGVHSVLSLPLLTPDGVLGAMNVYAHAKNAFDERSAQLGELFAVPAAISVQNAQVLAQARRLAEQLRSALTNRSVIDQAIGVMMSRAGGTPAEAFDRLRTISQSEHIKVYEVARSIVDDAVRRAKARRPSD